MYNDIFRGANERSAEDYIDGLTFVGSKGNDIVAGGTAGDTLSGLSGNDDLDGGAGDDLVMGGAGMDRLSGGTGSNLLIGGLDADTYVSSVSVTLDLLSDSGGVDRLDLNSFSITDAVFSRYSDSLCIRFLTSGGETIEIENQWLEHNRIEQFTFADGTYAASYIEYLADTSGGSNVCYDGPNPVICGPYAMPVVLDLDGNGINLIDVSQSRARFDVDNDGHWERTGWVGVGDGVLAIDRNGNGRIDDFSEISFLGDFLGAGSDLEGLLAYDNDGDGFLTHADNRFSEFLVWSDSNGNGHSERNELSTLDQLGIVRIGLERQNIRSLDADAETNQVLALSSFETVDGRSHLVGDVALFREIDGCGCAFMAGSFQPYSFETIV